LFHDDNKVIDNPDLDVVKVINPAYEILSDPIKRAQYDQQLKTPQAASVRYERGSGWQNAPFLDVLIQMMSGQLDYFKMFPDIFSGQGNWGANTWPNTGWPGGVGAAAPEMAQKTDYKVFFEQLKYATTFSELHRLLVKLGGSTYKFKLPPDKELLPGQILKKIELLKKAIATDPGNDERITAYVNTLKPLGAGLGQSIALAVNNSLPRWRALINGQSASLGLLRNNIGALMDDWDDIGLLDEHGQMIIKFSHLHEMVAGLAKIAQTPDQAIADRAMITILQVPTRFDLDLQVLAFLLRNTKVHWSIPFDKKARYEAYKTL
jgi:hypothetical protein